MWKRDPKIDRMKTSTTFARLGNRKLRALAQYIDDVEMAAGTKLMTEGSFAYELLVIVEGAADVVVGGQKVGEVGPGAVLGEMALLQKGKRTATVVTSTESKMLVMTGRTFNDLVEKHPEVAAELRSIAEERAASNARLTS
jgi:CRP-like cAMP-binding protein